MRASTEINSRDEMISFGERFVEPSLQTGDPVTLRIAINSKVTACGKSLLALAAAARLMPHLFPNGLHSEIVADDLLHPDKRPESKVWFYCGAPLSRHHDVEIGQLFKVDPGLAMPSLFFISNISCFDMYNRSSIEAKLAANELDIALYIRVKPGEFCRSITAVYSDTRFKKILTPLATLLPRHHPVPASRARPA
jgi:hypothetical protein